MDAPELGVSLDIGSGQLMSNWKWNAQRDCIQSAPACMLAGGPQSREDALVTKQLISPGCISALFAQAVLASYGGWLVE